MRNNIAESILGAIVLIVGAAILLYAYSVNHKSDLEKGYTLLARFDRVDGIIEGNEVRLSGINVGYVKKLSLDPKTYLAVVTLEVDENIKLPTDTVAQISSESLLGGKYLALIPGGSEEMLKPNAEITHTQSSVNLESLIGQIVFNSDDKK